MKLLDKIKRYFRNKGLVVRSPIRKVKKQGKVTVIQPYDLELDLLLKAEEKEKENSLPHPYAL